MRIETNNLILRKFTFDDAVNVSNVSKQESVAIEMSDMILEDQVAAVNWIKMVNSNKMANKLTMLAVESKLARRCIGYVYLHSKAELYNEVELAYAIHDDFQNKGFATEAGAALIDWAFRNMNVEYLVAIVKPVNRASQKVIEKLKFKKFDERIVEHDGESKQYYYYKLNSIDWLG